MAQNFSSSVYRDVDPRTGQFKPTINLGSVTGNYGLGPHFPIVLRYAPGNSVNEGFGIGWSLSVASFDYSKQVLNHSNGSNWAIDGDAPAGGEYKLKYQKLKDFRFLALHDGYCIWNAHGDAIILGGAKFNLNSSMVCLPTTMITTAGHQISFRYTDDGKLKSVKDGDDTILVSVTYTSNSATLTVFPGTSFTQIYNFNIEYNYLKSITYETTELGTLKWEFETGTNAENRQTVRFGDNLTLLAITYPTGTRESVIYNINSDGFRVPGGGFVPSINSATSDYGAGQKKINKHYKYDSTLNNYMGYGSGINYTSQNSDELYNSTNNNYTYSVTEEVLDENGGVSFSTRYTYNKYHLLAEEFYTNNTNSATRLTRNTYDKRLFDNTPHDNLPSWFQNALKIDVTNSVFSDENQNWSSKTLTKTREYYGSDSISWDGLLKSETYSDNKKITHEYYKADGTEAGCPKDPYVITNNSAGWPSTYNSAMEIWDISDPTQDVSVARVEFDYTQLTQQANAHPDFPTQQFLLQSESRLKTAGKYAIQKLTKYCSNNSSNDYTHISSSTINSIITENSSNYKVGSIGSSISENYSYAYNPNATGQIDTIIKTTTKSGMETTTSNESRCRYRGTVTAAVDESRNKHSYKYGTTGIVTQELYSPLLREFGTTVNHTYGIQTIGNSIFNTAKSELILNNPNNGPANALYSGQNHWLDGAGRPVKIERSAAVNVGSNISNLNYNQIASYEYNYFGEVASIVSMDLLPGNGSSVNATLTRQHLYNEFKSLSGYIYPLFGSNREVNSTFDPATTTTTIIDNSVTECKKKKVDILNSIIENKILDEDGVNELHKSIYNFSIFGTLESNVEYITGNREEEQSVYEYKYESDYLGRPIKRTYPDGTSISLVYDVRFIQPRVTYVIFTGADGKKITIFNCEYNERSLLIKRSLFGRDLNYAYYYSYVYDDNRARLIQKTLSDRKTTVNYIYNDSIGGKLTQIQTNDTRVQNYLFDALGNEIQINETYKGSACTFIKREVDSLGRVTSENYNTGGNPYAQIKIRYSESSSKITSYTDANNLQTFNYYDILMNIVRTENAAMRTDFKYDDYNRVITKSTWSMKNWNEGTNSGEVDTNSLHTTSYIYDSKSGYNTKITETSASSGQSISIDMTYRSDGLLATRTYGPLDRKATRQRSELFIYDIRKRLSVYTCNGTQLISDSTGKNITKQVYKYDALNNILSITTTYASGSSNQDSVKSFKYRTDNPFLLDTITVDSENPIQINYDIQFDRAVSDDQGRSFTYDSLERIASVHKSGVTTKFTYDATNSLRQQVDSSLNKRYFFYDGFSLDAEFKIDNKGIKTDAISRIHSPHGYIGQYNSSTNKFEAIPLDSLDNTIFADSDSKQLSSGITPFGDSYNPSSVTPSYRGEVYNEALGGYYLGRGYRLYNPRICRFNKPDSLAPHTAAGINPFAYAHNDPINHSDPDGHSPQSRGRGWNKTMAWTVGAFGLIAVCLTLTPAIAAGTEIGGALIAKSAIKLGIVGVGVFAGEEAAKNANTNSDASHTYMAVSMAVLGFGAYSAYGDVDRYFEREMADTAGEGAIVKRVDAGTSPDHSKLPNKTPTVSDSVNDTPSLGHERHPEFENIHNNSDGSELDHERAISASRRTSVVPQPVGTDADAPIDYLAQNFTRDSPSHSSTRSPSELTEEVIWRAPSMASLRDENMLRRHTYAGPFVTTMSAPTPTPAVSQVAIYEEPPLSPLAPPPPPPPPPPQHLMNATSNESSETILRNFMRDRFSTIPIPE